MTLRTNEQKDDPRESNNDDSKRCGKTSNHDKNIISKSIKISRKLVVLRKIIFVENSRNQHIRFGRADIQ